MKLRLVPATTLAVLAATAPAAAQDQPWLADRRFGEGIGIRSGNFEFHPGISAELGYDSNYYQRAENEPVLTGAEPLPVEEAWRLRVTPQLTLSTLSARLRQSPAVGAPPALTLQARLFASYNELFGSTGLSEERHVDYGLSAQAGIFPQGRLGADVHGAWLVTAEPSNQPDASNASFDRGTVSGGAGVSFRPGGGLFSWRVGYGVGYNYFHEQTFESLDNVQHSVETRGRWRFLPRSALLYDAEYTLVRYHGPGAEQPDGDYVEARVGFSGLVTKQLAFLALAGWNSSYYEPRGVVPAQDYDGYVAHGELKYLLLPAPSDETAPVGISSVAAGFLRSFSNSYLGSFYIRNRGYMNTTYFLGGVFVASLEGGLSWINFPDPNPFQQSFDQTRIDVRLFGEYRFSDIFAVNTTLLYDQVLSPDEPIITGPAVAGEQPQDDLTYKRFQAYLGMRVFW